jgi:mono/diheme cytochrome c family protein
MHRRSADLGHRVRGRRWALVFAIASTPSTHAAGPTYADVAPILTSRCVICHSGANAPLDLRLDSFEGVLRGSRNGPVVQAGNPGQSEMIRRVKGLSQPRMPMTGPPFLSDDEIGRIEAWIESGLQPGDSNAPQQVAAPAQSTGLASAGPPTYEQVAPIFARRCAKCHTDQGQMGPAPEGYRLTSYASTVSEADRVRVVPGNPAASELVRRIRGQARPRMPFDGPPFLAPNEIMLIEEWIAQGARDSNGSPASVPTGAKMRLHGTLSERWRLDDLTLTVTRDTRIDKAPRPGDYVEVRGTVRADGTLVVERIRRR